MCLALKHSHDHRVIHRDLKTQNILISENRLKIGDFGLAWNMRKSQSVLTQFMGTPLYLAPEIIND